ncbi:hypothetical protein EI94DRAFT_1706639 [Lactarius quietus]|nr:hypothetical protein EI94DRAFT_1706639 [Lactarius quietus]
MAVNLLVLQPGFEPFVVSVAAKEPGQYSKGLEEAEHWFLAVTSHYCRGPPIAILLGKHDSEDGRDRLGGRRALVWVTDTPLSIGVLSPYVITDRESNICESVCKEKNEGGHALDAWAFLTLWSTLSKLKVIGVRVSQANELLAGPRPTCRSDNIFSLATHVEEHTAHAVARHSGEVVAEAPGVVTTRQNGDVDIITRFDGGYSTGDPSYEGDVDLEYSAALTYPSPHTFYSTGGLPLFKPDSSTPVNNNETYLEWPDCFLDQPNVPQMISSGYGDDEQTVPVDYATTVCLLFAQLGARGVSSIVDIGVGRGNCEANNGSGKFYFIFLISPRPRRRNDNAGPEAAVPPSSGGFSNYFKVQSYQSGAVSPCLQTLDLATQYLNFSVVVTFELTNASTATTAGTQDAILVDNPLSLDGMLPVPPNLFLRVQLPTGPNAAHNYYLACQGHYPGLNYLCHIVSSSGRKHNRHKRSRVYARHPANISSADYRHMGPKFYKKPWGSLPSGGEMVSNSTALQAAIHLGQEWMDERHNCGYK